MIKVKQLPTGEYAVVLDEEQARLLEFGLHHVTEHRRNNQFPTHDFALQTRALEELHVALVRRSSGVRINGSALS